MGYAGVVIRKVLAWHDILAAGALNEEVPKPLARETFEYQLLQQALQL